MEPSHSAPFADGTTPPGVLPAALNVDLSGETTHEVRQNFQRLYRALIDCLPQRVFVKDRNSTFISVNAVLAADFGHTPQEMIGKTDYDLFPKDLAEKYRDDDQRIMAQGRAEMLEEVFTSSGKTRIIQVHKSPLVDATGEVMGLLGIFTDVTERKRTAVQLKKSEEIFRRVWENSIDGMRLTDEEGIVLLVNDAFCRLAGKSREELVGQPFSMIYEVDQQQTSLAKHKERFAARNIEPLFEREMLLWHGGKVWFELSNSFIEIEGQPPQLLSVFRDTTERRVAEEKLRDFTARLERSNRELQDFAYVASHDLQEPLRKVTVFGDRLKAKHGEAIGEEGRDYLDRMLKASERMQALISGLLNFSRVTSKSQPFVPVDLGLVAREILSDLETRIEQVGAKVEVGPLPTVEAESLQMHQVLQNLVGNALKFHRPEVKLVIKIEATTIRDPQRPTTPSGQPRHLVQLTVSDNGIGFDEKYVDRIFQVFQRLHSRAAYEGTGMGLAIARKIAEHHGGGISAKSKLGEGSTFIVTLPLKQYRTI